MKKMKTKEDMVNELSTRLGINKSRAGEVHQAVSEMLMSAIEQRQPISLFGLGTVQVSKRRAYVGVNPNTGEEWALPESYHAKLKPSLSVKKRLKDDFKS